MTYTTDNLSVSVDTDTGINQSFNWYSVTPGESYTELGRELSSIRDSFISGVGDVLAIGRGSPSQPHTDAGSYSARLGDDPFIDVDITPPGA